MIMAQWIIEAAKKSERDPAQLARWQLRTQDS
jgi:hypothetical protein